MGDLSVIYASFTTPVLIPEPCALQRAPAAEFQLRAGDFAQLVLERGQNNERYQLPEEPTTIQQSVSGAAPLPVPSHS